MSVMVGGAHETPTALCYGADGIGVPCWIVATFDSVALVARTYRSYDGVSWASFTNTIPAGLSLARLAGLGSQVVAVVQGAAPARVVFSIDGGATWQTSNGAFVALQNGDLKASNNSSCSSPMKQLPQAGATAAPAGSVPNDRARARHRGRRRRVGRRSRREAIVSGFPIRCGVCELARVGGVFSCTLTPANSTPGTSAPTFSAGDVGAVYGGTVVNGELDSRFARLAALVTSASPPTAVAPDLLDAVCAALLCYAVVVLGFPMGPHSDDAWTVLINASGALWAASRAGAGLIGTTRPIPITGFVLP